MTTRSFGAAYFDGLYQQNPDPWNFAGSDYERAKYAATLAALPSARYVSGLEIGCSIGILTRQLAARCDHLLALDIAAEPLVQARRHCQDLQQVDFLQAQVPRDWPPGRHDLIVLSEVLYFLDADDIRATAAAAVASLAPGGIVLVVNWLGLTDYPTSGTEALRLFREASGLTSVFCEETDAYRIERFG